MNGEEVNIRDFSGNRTLVNFDTGDAISLISGADGVRFLLISGKPIQEPVAWHGPIVMNTQAELAQAFKELQNGTLSSPYINITIICFYRIMVYWLSCRLIINYNLVKNKSLLMCTSILNA